MTNWRDINWSAFEPDQDQRAGVKLSGAGRIRLLLVNAIGAGALAAGTRLIETELGAALAVSRTPLREALSALRSEQLVEHDGDGLRVRLLGWRDVSDLYDMRATLEGMAARLAATTGSQVERQVIGALCEEEGRLIAEGAEARALAEHNQKFHQAILKTANNQFLAESLSRLSRLTILLGHTVYSLPMRQHAIIQEHEDITQAILSQDGAQAEQMMRYHLERALQARLQIMSDGRE